MTHSTSRDRLGEVLGLRVPAVPWHAHRDRLAGLACALGLVCGTLGKIARDLLLLSQTEIGEVAEGQSGGSSTMPHKRNPVQSSRVLAAAIRAPRAGLDHAERDAAGARARARRMAGGVGHSP